MTDATFANFGTPKEIAPEYNGPNGFCWLVSGLLGGTPKPGVFRDTTRDLEALERVNTYLLVSLTEEWEPDPDLIQRYNMRSLHVPITDLHPPTIAQAERICSEVQLCIEAGKAVVFHCHAGKGRTGTLLAAMLIWNGMASGDAVAYTRNRNPKWIETQSQIDFLDAFARHLGL